VILMENFSPVEANSFSRPNSTRNAIVGVLSRKWPVSARELHLEVERNQLKVYISLKRDYCERS